LSRYNITALVKLAVGLSYPEKPESCLPDGRQGGNMKTYLDKLMENKEFKEKFEEEFKELLIEQCKDTTELNQEICEEFKYCEEEDLWVK
jgi:hypothetical protein